MPKHTNTGEPLNEFKGEENNMIKFTFWKDNK